MVIVHGVYALFRYVYALVFVIASFAPSLAASNDVWVYGAGFSEIGTISAPSTLCDFYSTIPRGDTDTCSYFLSNQFAFYMDQSIQQYAGLLVAATPTTPAKQYYNLPFNGWFVIQYYGDSCLISGQQPVADGPNVSCSEPPNPCYSFDGSATQTVIDGVELCTWEPAECTGGDVTTSTDLLQCEISCASTGGFYASGQGCIENDGSFTSQSDCVAQGGYLGLSNGTVSCLVGQLANSSTNNDADGDGVPNEYDDDIDGDGIPNETDPTVYGDSVYQVNQQISNQILTTNTLITQLAQASASSGQYDAANNEQLVALNERMVALDLNFSNMYTSLEDTRVLIDGYEAQAYQQDSEVLNEVIALNTQTNTNLEGVNAKLQAIADTLSQTPDEPIDLSTIETELTDIEAAIARLETIAGENQLQDDEDSQLLADVEANTGRTATAAEGVLGFLTEQSEIPEQVTDYDTIAGSLWGGITDAPIVVAISDYQITYGGAGECPRPSLTVFNETFEITMHCDLYALIAGAMSALMYVIWSITAFRVLASV